MLGSLLFKIVSTPDKELAMLVIPEMCADSIIALYRSSLFAGYQGGTNTYLAISNNLFYTQPNTLFKIVHRRLSYMST